MILYNLFNTSQGIRITKWDHDFNVEASYLVSDKTCECPAMKPCKHMEMMRLLWAEIDQNTFYDPETDTKYELNHGC